MLWTATETCGLSAIQCMLDSRLPAFRISDTRRREADAATSPGASPLVQVPAERVSFIYGLNRHTTPLHPSQFPSSQSAMASPSAETDWVMIEEDEPSDSDSIRQRIVQLGLSEPAGSGTLGRQQNRAGLCCNRGSTTTRSGDTHSDSIDCWPSCWPPGSSHSGACWETKKIFR